MVAGRKAVKRKRARWPPEARVQGRLREMRRAQHEKAIPRERGPFVLRARARLADAEASRLGLRAGAKSLAACPRHM